MPNGKFMSNRVAIITLKTGHRATKAESTVHKRFPSNVISGTQIVNEIGPVLFDKMVYQKVKPKLNHIARRKNKLLKVSL